LLDPDHHHREIGIGLSRSAFSWWYSQRPVMQFASSVHAKRTDMSAKSTKKARKAKLRDEMREHYDFRGAARGRFPEFASARVVVLSDDVWQHFGSDAAIASALRGLVETAKFVKPRVRRARRAA
jgi:hypothetical protein